MVKLFHCHAGIFLRSKDPDLEDLGRGSFQKDYEGEVIQSLKTAGDFIKSFYSKFGLNKKPPQPLVAFASNYFANPYHWLITIPSPYHPTSEPISSVTHETAHCIHWKANPEIWGQRDMIGRKSIEARFMTELVAELSTHMYLEQIGTLKNLLENFPQVSESNISRRVINEYDFLKENFETLALTKSTESLPNNLRSRLF